MIVPKTRLLVWTGLSVLPFAAAVEILPAAGGLSAAAIAAALVVFLADAALASRSLHGISIEFPGEVRLAKGREGAVEFRMKHGGKKPKTLSIGLAFPPEISTPSEVLAVKLPGGAEVSHGTWPCTALRRGRYLFDACYVECSSPLGLWAFRRAFPAQFELRVYPDLLAERKNAAALFLNRGNFGVHGQRQVGQGREFEKLREYVHGDGFDHIHWKATAKRGRPVTKVFQIERTQEVYVVIDSSRLSGRAIDFPRAPENGGRPERQKYPDTMLERFINAALIMAAAAQRQGDLFGLVTFSDRVQDFVGAKNGREHYNRCRDALYALHPRRVTPDFDELFSFIATRMRRRALLVFLTSLDDPVLAESFVRNIDLVRRTHLVLVNMLRPAGVRPLFSRPDVRSADDLYADLGGHLLRHDLLELEKIFRRRGVGFSLVDSEAICGRLVSQYMAVKQRQIL